MILADPSDTALRILFSEENSANVTFFMAHTQNGNTLFDQSVFAKVLKDNGIT